MKQGKLFYDSTVNRLNIRFDDGSESGGLHCGHVLEVLCPCCNEWREGRVECNDKGWYLARLGELGRSAFHLFTCPVRAEV